MALHEFDVEFLCLFDCEGNRVTFDYTDRFFAKMEYIIATTRDSLADPESNVR